VTSDHGETIREDANGHMLYLYDELTRVPLYVRWPACLPGGRRAREPHRDTVDGLVRLGVEVPPMAGGIALSESFGAIFAPDERRLGARVSRSADWRATTGPATVSWLFQ